jgi:hypothetical protein
VTNRTNRSKKKLSKIVKFLMPRGQATKGSPRFSDQVFTKAFDDDKRSVASGQSAKVLSSALFFDSTTAKSAAEIGEASGTGDYPALDKCWDH